MFFQPWALIAIPTVFIAALMYSRWSSKWGRVASFGISVLGLAGVLLLEFPGAGGFDSPVLPVAFLIIGSNGWLATLLPYAAESYPLRVRGRATGWVASCSKFGGLIAQFLSLLGVVPVLWVAALAIMVPTLLAMALIAYFGDESRGRDLREVDAIPAG